MKIIVLFLACFLVTGIGPGAFASAPDLAQKVQARYDDLQALKADYVQILTSAATRDQEERTGRIYFKKPLLIRWVAETPEPELLVVDGEKVWNYFPDEETVYEYEAEDMLTSRSMLNFISGRAKLDEDFRIEHQGEENDLSMLKLIPKNPEPDLVLAYLWVDEEGLLHGIKLVDFFGNENELRFKSLKIDPELSADKFIFEAPETADVIKD